MDIVSTALILLLVVYLMIGMTHAPEVHRMVDKDVRETYGISDFQHYIQLVRIAVIWLPHLIWFLTMRNRDE